MNLYNFNGSLNSVFCEMITEHLLWDGRIPGASTTWYRKRPCFVQEQGK